MLDTTNENAPPLAGGDAFQETNETKLTEPIVEGAQQMGNTDLTWTEFPDKSGNTSTVRHGTWADLIERLRTVGRFKSKEQCPLIKCASFGSKRSDKGSLRHNGNVQSISGIVCDYDGEQVQMEQAIVMLEKYGIRAALYPTPSNTAGKPRWRAICPVAQQRPSSAHSALVARLNGALGGILAGESFTLSQAYYFGVLPENEYRVLPTFGDTSAGQCIDTLDELDGIAIGKIKKTKEQARRDSTDPFNDCVGSDTIRDLRSALCALRADDRVLWISIGHALKTLGDQGRALWLEWSQTSEKYDPEDASTKWDGFAPNGTSYKAVFAKAQAARWVNPRAKVDRGSEDIPWPEIADPFVEYVVPAFPVEALPESFATLCRELSAQSGFDVGGYAFSLLVTASSLIDHRKKLKAGPLVVPPFLWGGLVANSGGGKSPILSSVMSKVRAIDEVMVKNSSQELAQWKTQCEMSGSNAPRPPKPLWRQLIANDITVEALVTLLRDNPSGVLLAHDELTEFIGRMDAYSGSGAGSKDRGVYLRAFDGGNLTVNRQSTGNLVVPNFSVGIITGIQPEMLAALFKKSSGGADGLYQRLLVYAMQPAGAVNYSVIPTGAARANADKILQILRDQTETEGFSDVELCTVALPLMEKYHQQARTMAQRTGANRLAEHLDKFPGFLARMTFALHCIECAERGVFVAVVSVDTFQRAKQIMTCLYHHSVAVYAVLDSQAGEISRLAKSACEAILSKGWAEVKRGDLTRHATHWQGADDRTGESAIDFLIELGWLHDVTPATEPGKRGRRSRGLFVVNPLVPQRFQKHAERIRSERELRWVAIQEIAAQRGEKPKPE